MIGWVLKGSLAIQSLRHFRPHGRIEKCWQQRTPGSRRREDQVHGTPLPFSNRSVRVMGFDQAQTQPEPLQNRGKRGVDSGLARPHGGMLGIQRRSDSDSTWRSVCWLCDEGVLDVEERMHAPLNLLHPSVHPLLILPPLPVTHRSQKGIRGGKEGGRE
eukprot:2379395-Rhodomonas_salina.1